MRRDWYHLVFGGRGSTVPEYALLLGIVVVSAGLACWTAAASVSRVYMVAAQFNGTRDAAEGIPPALADDGRFARHASAADHLSPQQQRLPAGLVAALGVLVFGVALASGLSALKLIRRRHAPADSPGGDAANIPPLTQPSLHDQLMEKRWQIRQILGRGLESGNQLDTQVQHLMSKRLSVVRPNVPVAEAVAIMNDKHIRHLLICGSDGRLLGILSDRDIKQRTGALVRDIMTAAPVTVTPELAIGPAITLMLQRSISCLPVVHDGALVGVLTTTDILLSCQCMMQVLERVAAGLYDRPESRTLLSETW